MDKTEKLKLKINLIVSRAQILSIIGDPNRAPYFQLGDCEKMEESLVEIELALKDLETN